MNGAPMLQQNQKAWCSELDVRTLLQLQDLMYAISCKASSQMSQIVMVMTWSCYYSIASELRCKL